MALLSRILVAVIGLLSLLGSLQHWFKVDALVTERGIQAVGDIGRANIRADVGGLFIGIGLFAIIAAAKQNKTWLLAATLLTGSALMGRFVSVAIDGYSPRVGPPMVIEAVVVAIYLVAFQLWGKKPEGL
jgi:hypothetical protein